MPSLMNEYIQKRWGPPQLTNELQRLIREYNRFTGRWLFIYSSDVSKASHQGVNVSLNMEDFQLIQDILHDVKAEDIDFYIETPGGSGEAAEEIARFLHKNFKNVHFIIAGEAKSAGTILALSGDDISMTDSGSLGPIDAQVHIGRTTQSAYDYLKWVREKRDEAAKNGSLNTFDAIMIAQISPGELEGVESHFTFATTLVEEWLCKYKFKNWKKTRTRQLVVTEEMKRKRAKELAEKLANHSLWKSHGRSLKIEDLSDLLLINRIDDEPKLSDIVYRINAVIRLLFGSSTYYKIFFSEDTDMERTIAIPGQAQQVPIPINPKEKNHRIEIGINCPKCHTENKVFGYLNASEESLRRANLPRDRSVKGNRVICKSCEFPLDLSPIKAGLESQLRKQIIF